MGYGMVKLYKKQLQAHRVAYEIANGPITDSRLVLHRCDNRSCVRPDHLMLGDHVVNRHDCVTKGRANVRYGQRHHCVKLTEDAVRAIRLRRAAGELQTSLALEYGVTRSTIYGVSTGREWKHVT